MPSKLEEKHFKEEEERKLRALQEKAKKEEEEKIKVLCKMRCPKCGSSLKTVTKEGVEIDRCLSCEGIWLDAGELETIAEKTAGKKASFFSLLLRKK